MEKHQSILDTPMLEDWKAIISTILAVVFSYLVLEDEIASLYQTYEGLIGALLMLCCAFLKLVLVFIGVYSALRLFGGKKSNFIIPFILACGTIIAVISITWMKYARDSSSIVIEATYNEDISRMDLILRKNNTYEFRDLGFLGGDYHYGNYLIKNDTIYLSRKLPRNLGSNKLLIKEGFIFLKVDKNDSVIDNGYNKLTILNRTG